MDVIIEIMELVRFISIFSLFIINVQLSKCYKNLFQMVILYPYHGQIDLLLKTIMDLFIILHINEVKVLLNYQDSKLLLPHLAFIHLNRLE